MKHGLRCGFSHDYHKLWHQTSAKLLEVKRVNKDDIDEIALNYDTVYTEGHGSESVRKHYALEPGRYLRLTFIGNLGIPFTTYRTDTVEHYEKYAPNVGKEFKIYVNEDPK